MLKAFNGLVSLHRVVIAIKSLVKDSSVKTFAHWIRMHGGQPGSKRADVLAKPPTKLLKVDVVIKLTTNQAKEILLTCDLAK